jgi:hypothetical protein
MPEITVTLVDHTNSPQLMPLIQKHLADIFSDLLTSSAETPVVNIRSIAMTPKADDQDLVLHFVDNIANSYVAANMPGPPITPIDGGVTRPGPKMTGSEFYKFPTRTKMVSLWGSSEQSGMPSSLRMRRCTT